MIRPDDLLVCSIQTDPDARRRVGSVIVETIEEGERIIHLTPMLIRTCAVWLPADAVLIIQPPTAL